MGCFISYSASDASVARCLKAHLSAKAIDVFLAEDSIDPGSPWPSVIQTSAKRCEVMVLLDSADSRKSVWVQQEAGMALASGSLIIPVSLDGRLDRLPGWLSGIQAIRRGTDENDEGMLSRVANQVSDRLSSPWRVLPPELQKPETVAASVLRSILLDQYSGPPERVGAWSRQCDRYLRLAYRDSTIPVGVSQGASLTLSGLAIEHLTRFLSCPSGGIAAAYTTNALERAEAFCLSSQDPQEGGFGRLSSEFRTRGGRARTLDIRHTCWGIRSLLSIDEKRMSPQIDHGLEWLARRARNRSGSDRGSWTAAPLLSLLIDPRLSNRRAWQECASSLSGEITTDLEESFDATFGSWDSGEGELSWECIDNALYVLYCLSDCHDLPARLDDQRRLAIRRLWAWSVPSANREDERGIPFYGSQQPEIGPTAFLMEIMMRMGQPIPSLDFENFIASSLQNQRITSYTFPWHLSSVLAIPDLRNRKIAQ